MPPYNIEDGDYLLGNIVVGNAQTLEGYDQGGSLLAGS